MTVIGKSSTVKFFKIIFKLVYVHISLLRIKLEYEY